jgi:hypothetical protein
MRLIEIYNMLEKGELKLEEAARAFDMTPRNLKFRLTTWGHRLPLLLSTLDKIRDDRIDRQDAAKVLDVSGREVNHLMLAWKIKRPVKQYVVDRTRAEVKWEIRKKYAIDYIAGHMEIEDAAEAADVSERQMRRWVSEMLMKHYEMPFKDLKEVSNHRRMRLAAEIVSAEGIEDDKKRVIDSISLGKTDMADEVITRVMTKVKGRKRKPS